MLTFIALVSGCASTQATREQTEYRESPEYSWGKGVGVSHSRQGQDVFEITAAGFDATPNETLLGWIVQRALEVCPTRTFVMSVRLPRIAFHRASGSPDHPDKWEIADVECGERRWPESVMSLGPETPSPQPNCAFQRKPPAGAGASAELGCYTARSRGGMA